MKIENSKNEKLERKRTVLFQVGMVVSLALVLLAFEWRSPKTALKPIEWENNSNFEEDMTSITIQKEKPAMPLPKVIQVFQVVIDKTEIDEKIDFIFEEPDDAFNDPNFYDDFKTVEIVPEDTAIYDYPSKYPEFPRGTAAMFSYLGEHLKYTELARSINLQGTVHVSFVVWKDGSIRDVEILRGLGAGLDDEVIRVIQGMPDWNPGMQQGKYVNVRYRIPVKFSLK